MRGPIDAHPERTPTEIENDAREADVFFNRWNWEASHGNRPERWVSRPDLDRRIRAESFSGSLTACEAEGRGYSYTVAPNNTYAAKKKREEALSARVEAEHAIVMANRRPYVTAKMSRELPKPRAIRLPYKQRAANQRTAAGFWSRIASPTKGPSTRDRILAEANISFHLWLLKNPHYGSLRPAPEGYAGTNPALKPAIPAEVIERREARKWAKERAASLRPWQYKNRDIRPVGSMTLDRAMQIAVKVLESK